MAQAAVRVEEAAPGEEASPREEAKEEAGEAEREPAQEWVRPAPAAEGPPSGAVLSRGKGARSSAAIAAAYGRAVIEPP